MERDQPSERRVSITIRRQQGRAKTTNRTSPQKNVQRTLEFFKQTLDIDNACNSCLQNFKNSASDSINLMNTLQEEQWKDAFEIPILTKY